MTCEAKGKTNNLNRLHALPPAALRDTTGWSTRHLKAVTSPGTGFERAYVEMLRGWLRYADVHATRYDSGIGDDGVLGPLWARIGDALLGLLNGDLGNMDGGTLDGIIRDTLLAEDFDPDTL